MKDETQPAGPDEPADQATTPPSRNRAADPPAEPTTEPTADPIAKPTADSTTEPTAGPATGAVAASDLRPLAPSEARPVEAGDAHPVGAGDAPPVDPGEARPTDDGIGAPALAFPVVAIGASAGGVEAVRRFLEATPADSGMAFVVLLHLDPRRDSHLPELLQACTRMPVVHTAQGLRLEPNRVYVLPPAQYLTLQDGRLRLEPMGARPPAPKTIDRFLESLAHDQHERAICVILSGLDGDGAAGVKEIKAEGGMAVAQAPETAAHPSMPMSAVATGLVDHLLPIERMPAAIRAYAEHASLDAAAALAPAEAGAELLAEVLELLRLRTGLDFRHYKKGMLLRRVRRRMGLCNIRQMAGYLQHLREHVDEVRALADDFLIGVTAFFREPETWAALEAEVLPALVARASPDAPLRAWVPACSTGEEAYTLAMLLIEQFERIQHRARVYVFATDINRAALEVARNGVYPESIAASVSPERLQRFFHRIEGAYQVRKELRETVVFAPQNLVSDPPFSRLDLVSCRNLLIYLEADLQRRLMQLFHFALNPGGVLMLGKSENIGHHQGLFEPAIAAALRIYRAVGPHTHRPLDLPLAPATRDGVPGHRVFRPDLGRGPGYGEVTRQALLELHTPAAVLVNRDQQALYYHGATEAYLAPPRGEPTSNLLALVREPLRPQLRAALHGALAEGRRTELTATMIAAEGPQRVTIAVTPVHARGNETLALVAFQRMPMAVALEAQGPQHHADVVGDLERELSAMRHELQGAIEDLEAANEELKVANEEAMSMNEELQSTNEELETSKEELQSVNEELTTVNHQLAEKVAELESINDDLSNLLTSSHVPTLFLDRRFRIKRFTPAATRLFSMIATDVDRPITDIASRCDLQALLEDARRVLQTLAPVERELRADGEHWLCRTLPYRTGDDRIDGVVIIFTDVSELKRASEGLRKLAAVLRLSDDAILVHDLDGHVTSWSRGAEAMYGWSEAESLGSGIERLLPDAAAQAEHARLVARVRAGETVQAHETRRRTRDGRIIDVAMTLSVLPDEAGRPAAIAAIERDVTERRLAEQALREREARFRALADSAPVIIWMSDAEGRIDFVNRQYQDVTGLPPEQLLGDRWHEAVHPEDVQAASRAWREALARRARLESAFRLRCADGDYHWTTTVGVPRQAPDGAFQGYVGITIDVHHHRTAEAQLRQADARKDEFLAMLGHELRNPLVPIRNAVEVLRRIDGGDPRLAWTRETIARQTLHLTRLVDDLLDVSRISRGAITLHREPVELDGAVRRAVEIVEPRLRHRRQRLTIEPAGAPLWVEGDAVRLVQMVDNLLTNASKYTGERGEIRVVLRAEGDQACVSVIDNGIGISPEALPHVFEMFVQEPRALDRSQGGLGIGLTLVRQLAHLHGGTVEADSEGTGKGARFTLRLPTIAQPPAPRAADEGAAHGQGARVLVVDDDPDAAESTTMVLELAGHRARHVADGKEALAALRAFHPDVVLMDIGMPGEDGYAVSRRLRATAEGQRAVFIGVSGFGQLSDHERSRQAGFATHLVKPVDPQRLFQAVAEALAQGAGQAKR